MTFASDWYERSACCAFVREGAGSSRFSGAVCAREGWRGGLASVAGEVLARVGFADASGELESALESAEADAKGCWARRLSLLDSILGRSGAGILRAFDRGRDNFYASGCFAPCDRYWVDLLVDVVAADEIRRLATTGEGSDEANGRILRAAIAKLARR